MAHLLLAVAAGGVAADAGPAGWLLRCARLLAAELSMARMRMGLTALDTRVGVSLASASSCRKIRTRQEW